MWEITYRLLGSKLSMRWTDSPSTEFRMDDCAKGIESEDCKWAWRWQEDEVEVHKSSWCWQEVGALALTRALTRHWWFTIVARRRLDVNVASPGVVVSRVKHLGCEVSSPVFAEHVVKEMRDGVERITERIGQRTVGGSLPHERFAELHSIRFLKRDGSWRNSSHGNGLHQW